MYSLSGDFFGGAHADPFEAVKKNRRMGCEILPILQWKRGLRNICTHLSLTGYRGFWSKEEVRLWLAGRYGAFLKVYPRNGSLHSYAFQLRWIRRIALCI